MDMTGEYRIKASREQVWAALNDAEVLAACIPGCDELKKISDTQFEATVTSKVGPVKAKFKGAVELSDIDPPNGYTISGEGKGGPAGFAKGGAKISLAEDGDETVLNYEVNANVGGKIAQLGARLIDGTAKKMAGEFFTKFAELAEEAAAADAAPEAAAAAAAEPAPAAPATPETPAPAPAPRSGGLPPVIWILGVIVVAALVIWLVI